MKTAVIPFPMPDFLPAMPEIFLLVMACVVMIVDLFVKSERRTASYLLTQLTQLSREHGTKIGVTGTLVQEPRPTSGERCG